MRPRSETILLIALADEITNSIQSIQILVLTEIRNQEEML